MLCVLLHFCPYTAKSAYESHYFKASRDFSVMTIRLRIAPVTPSMAISYHNSLLFTHNECLCFFKTHSYISQEYISFNYYRFRNKMVI